MKKTVLRIVALALLAVMAVSMFVACGGPNSDPKKAEEALKDAGYVVMAYDKDDALAGAVLETYGDGAEAVVSAMKEGEDDKLEAVMIIYYKDSASAKDAADKYLDDWKKESEEETEDIVAKRSGKLIYVGTKQAVKDAK